MKTLPEVFYVSPAFARVTMKKKDLNELLLATDGWISANGQMYDIISKHIGAGIYKVTVRLQKV